MPNVIDEIHKLVGETGVLTGDDVSARPEAWVRHTPMLAAAIAEMQTGGVMNENTPK